MAILTYDNSAVLTRNSREVIVALSEKIGVLSTDLTGWVVTIDAGANVVSSVNADAQTNKVLITLSEEVDKGDVVTVEYTGGGDIVSESTSEALAVFTSQSVINLVELIIENGDPALVTGAYTTGSNNIDLLYNAIKYTEIERTQLSTLSIMRQALNDAGILLTNDGPGKYSIIREARDSVLSSL